jgi:acetyl-CoA carboxylase carboxyl transferase subunit alpha
MTRYFLGFEQPIAELEAKIEELRMMDGEGDINLHEEVTRLERKCTDLTRSIFSNLTPWQVAQLARHPLRPQTMDYIEGIFTDFDELHGDRQTSEGPVIVGGTARLNGQPVMVIGHQKGRKTKEKVYRNFGMASPEDYRKALRLMKMAEKFQLPIFTLIDTAGAYPGITAEERNQSEAIARNLLEMADLKTPIICTVIGEGGSGGALAIGVGDKVLMLEYSIYSVISPEGCASILWKNAEKAEDAAAAMGITANRLQDLNLIDGIIKEPLGGAHRDPKITMEVLKKRWIETLKEFDKQPIDVLLNNRYQKWINLTRPSV